MGQNLHSVNVMAHKVEHTHENKVLIFLFMFFDYFYACAYQMHDCAILFLLLMTNLQAGFHSSKMP
jgi:hypothetical protein